MSEKDQLKKQLSELEEVKKPIEKRLREIYEEEAKEVSNKMKRCRAGTDKFELSELRFSAGARCSCGAGLAYPLNIGISGEWDCSDILLGRAVKSGKEGAKKHDGPLPFAFYEIKSEYQPSAQGHSTRPKE